MTRRNPHRPLPYSVLTLKKRVVRMPKPDPKSIALTPVLYRGNGYWITEIQSVQ